MIVDGGYCIQFNKGGTGKLYYVCLVKTERDPSEIEIDFSSKGFTTQGTKIIDGNGNILENGRCMLCGEYGIKLTSTECTRSSRPIPSTPTTTFRSATNTKKTVLTQAHVDALTTLRAANRRKPFQPRHRQLCRSRRHARDRRHRRRHRHLSHARRHLHPQRHPRRRNASGRDLHRSPGRTTKELHR